MTDAIDRSIKPGRQHAVPLHALASSSGLDGPTKYARPVSFSVISQ